MKTIIEVQAFGDFDVKYTVCIMVHPEVLNVNEILNEFYSINGISSNKGLSYHVLSTVNDDFISFLELKGFSILKTQAIYFCD